MTTCKHDCELGSGYGFAYASGWKGIGATWFCRNCFETLWFEDDREMNSEEEFKHNEIKRKENESWKRE